MNKAMRDFVSDEQRKFHFQFGRDIASALSGFLVGVVVASMFWLIGIWYLQAQLAASITDQSKSQIIFPTVPASTTLPTTPKPVK